MKIAILTPTYNREKLLDRLYMSLLIQSDKDFTWIVVDDGSTDGTEKLVTNYSKEGKISIRYIHKNNGGKAAALNLGFRTNPDMDFFAVVDSDDWLNEDGIEIIRKKVSKYEKQSSVGAIFFKYTDIDGNLLYTKSGNYLEKEEVMTRYEHDCYYTKEDGCIGYYSRAVNRYQYPEYKTETYVGPIVIQMLMAEEFAIAFTKEIIGTAEYQVGGLSKSGRKLRLNNPLGMILYCGLLQSPKNKSIKSRFKYCIEAQAYSFVARVKKRDLEKNDINPHFLKLWALLPGIILGITWKRKFCR